MAKKAENTEKPKRSYRKKTDAKPSVKRESKTPYNWRKHIKPKVQEEVQFQPEANTPEDELGYLLAEALVEKDMMFVELESWINKFPEALAQLKKHTGEIKVEDVTYHLELLHRIMKNKFT